MKQIASVLVALLLLLGTVTVAFASATLSDRTAKAQPAVSFALAAEEPEVADGHNTAIVTTVAVMTAVGALAIKQVTEHQKGKSTVPRK